MANITQTQNNQPDRPSGKTAAFKHWWRLLRNVGKEKWGDPMGYFFILPGLALFVTFQVWTIFRGFWMAFTDFKFLEILSGEPVPFIGFHNFYEFLFDDRYFWPALGRSLNFTFIYLPALFILAIAIASIIGRVKINAVAGFFRTSMYLPVILPTAVAVLMWTVMLRYNDGYVNYMLRDVLGLDFLAKNWLNDADTTVPVVAVMRIWKDVGFSAMLLLLGMYNINEQLYEAASIDGATGLQQWWYITLPLLKPVLVLVLVLNANIVSAAQEFMITYGAGELGPEQSALTLGYYTWLLAFSWGKMRMGYAASMGLLMGLISMIMSAVVFKVLKSERG